MTIERGWLLPCLLLTAAAVIFSALWMPTTSDLVPALQILPAWMAGSAILASVLATTRLAVRREPRPLSRMVENALHKKGRIASAGLVMALAGLNLVSFMWIKPLLNILFPFWADPILADLDNLMFLGHEPWTLVQWLNFPSAGLVYHPAWFFSIMTGLILTITSPASPERSAVLLSYFVLWTLVAPLIHSLLPAAGPIFFEPMGYGPRFSALPQQNETRIVANHLWSFYENGSFGAGNGISAMPSMHVATSTWVVIAVFALARRWFYFAMAGWLIIAGMSVALGWHYAVDGLVGAIAAVSVFLALRAIFRLANEYARPATCATELALR